jgi:hypothetical protein
MFCLWFRFKGCLWARCICEVDCFKLLKMKFTEHEYVWFEERIDMEELFGCFLYHPLSSNLTFAYSSGYVHRYKWFLSVFSLPLPPLQLLFDITFTIPFTKSFPNRFISKYYTSK